MSETFHGLAVHTVANAYLRVQALAEAGPRIVRLCLAGSDENLLVEQPAKHWETPFGTFYIRGGHRLWHAPEAFPRTYQPDNEGLSVEALPDGMALRGAVEAATGIRKTVTVRLAPDRAALEVRHELANEGLWAVELAPWAITQLPLGGVAVLPLYPPAPPATHLLPDRQITLWPYTRLADPRLHLQDEYILVEGRDDLPPAKVGAFSPAGWIGYLRHGVFLVKRFTPSPGLPHPDAGCNVECYYDQYNLEIETLGPLTRLAPGATVAHVEHWELHWVPDLPATAAGAAEAITRTGLRPA